MMIGGNKLMLNEATLIAALQMYLDSHRKDDAPKQKVESVKPASTNHQYGNDFAVALSGPES